MTLESNAARNKALDQIEAIVTQFGTFTAEGMTADRNRVAEMGAWDLKRSVALETRLLNLARYAKQQKTSLSNFFPRRAEFGNTNEEEAAFNKVVTRCQNAFKTLAQLEVKFEWYAMSIALFDQRYFALMGEEKIVTVIPEQTTWYIKS